MLPASKNLSVGDIYLVRFHPSIGSALKRYRPAVIVSGIVNKIDGRFTLIAPLSTNTKKLNKDYEFIVKSNESLEKDSVVLPWYLKTIDVVRLEKKLGALAKEDLTVLQAKLRKII